MARKYLYVVEATPRVKKRSPVQDIPWISHHPTILSATAMAKGWDPHRFRVSMYRYVKTAWPAQRQSAVPKEKP